MRNAPLQFFATLLICSMTLFSGPACAEPPVEFSWAVLTGTDEGLRPLDFTTPPKLKNGATIQIYLEQKPGVYLYLYLIDSSGEVAFLYPGEKDFYSKVAPSDRVFRLPTDTNRFELTPPSGQEKLYLLAGANRLDKLEKITAAFLDQPGHPLRKEEVVKELKRLRQEHSTLVQVTETSVPVAGTVRSRGVPSDSFEATKVNAVGFYSRILRIDHD
ncbi:MAG TPA: hypothetical protein DDY20_10200 [Desulfobulbaceae bacterium]|nr:hypothetical protein [Desulfobulbaceae bacterium]